MTFFYSPRNPIFPHHIIQAYNSLAYNSQFVSIYCILMHSGSDYQVSLFILSSAKGNDTAIRGCYSQVSAAWMGLLLLQLIEGTEVGAKQARWERGCRGGGGGYEGREWSQGREGVGLWREGSGAWRARRGPVWDRECGQGGWGIGPCRMGRIAIEGKEN